MVSFHILNRDWAKEISFVNYILPGPGVKYKNHMIKNLHYVYQAKKIADKVGSADRQRIIAIYFRKSIFKGSLLMLCYQA